MIRFKGLSEEHGHVEAFRVFAFQCCYVRELIGQGEVSDNALANGFGVDFARYEVVVSQFNLHQIKDRLAAVVVPELVDH